MGDSFFYIETWIKYSSDYPGLKVIFIFGTTKHQHLYSNHRLIEEQKQFCDLLQMDFVDTYKNVTMDTLSSLKFFLNWNWKGDQPDFLAIADDDTYVNVPAMWNVLFEDRIINKVYSSSFCFFASQTF